MKQKNYLTISKDFLDYCKLNKIEDHLTLASNVFESGFNFLKYGTSPLESNIKIEIKEVIKEIPVEVIIEKEVFKDNNVEMNKLLEENLELKKQINDITTKLESFNRKGTYMKGSDISNLYLE